MKTLVVIAHPDMKGSTVHKHWVKELKKYPERFTIHELYATYPDGKIDVLKEQHLIETHGALVLQFPVYWFNCPPLLKEWLDKVFTYGWAYGSTGNKMTNRKVTLAVSTGIDAKGYTREGQVKYTIEETLRPFELTMNYVKANYQSLYVFYGIDSNAAYDEKSLQKVTQSAQNYILHLNKL